MDRVSDDVGNVLINQRVHRRPALALHADKAGGTQHPQMLGDQRLADPKQVDQLVHESRPARQFGDDSQPGRSAEHLQQVPRRLERSRLS